MPPGGGVQYNGLWYTTAEWQAMGGAAGAGAAQSNQSVIDGKQMLQDFLNNYGLSSIDINAAWSAFVKSGSNLDYWTNTWLPTTSAFKAAYPVYDQLMKEGRGITVADYRNYVQTANSLAQQEGFPQGFVTQDDISKSLLAGVSTSELQQRFQDAGRIVNQLPTEDVNYLSSELGVSKGDLAAYWIDPSKALPLIEQKLAAAQVGGAAARAGIDLGFGQANQLAALGVSGSQAKAGFGNLANAQQLFTPLPGQNGNTMSQDQQVGAVFGTDNNAAQQLQQTAAQRKATFTAGGSYTSSNQGFVGAGTANGA
jgi:hypothetical protein